MVVVLNQMKTDRLSTSECLEMDKKEDEELSMDTESSKEEPASVLPEDKDQVFRTPIINLLKLKVRAITKSNSFGCLIICHVLLKKRQKVENITG